jgi:hypothetical protein
MGCTSITTGIHAANREGNVLMLIGYNLSKEKPGTEMVDVCDEPCKPIVGCMVCAHSGSSVSVLKSMYVCLN